MTDHQKKSGANLKSSLEARIVSTLDADSTALDPRVRQRLDRIRTEALSRADESTGRRFAGPLWTAAAAGMVAAVVALALAVVLVDQTPETEPPPITADLDLLTDPRFDLFVEDPEFVVWIAEAEPENPSTENSG